MIETGFSDNGEVKIPLSPPTFSEPAGVLDESKRIEIKHPIKSVEIRFSRDGSMPDSITSEVYKSPVLVDSSITLKARAFKQGWYGSGPVEAAFIRRRYKPDSVELISPTDAKYPLTNKDLLYDGDLGDLDFRNGQWLGYQNNEAAYLLYFKNKVSVHKVLLNLLENTGAHIFPPAQFEVWGGLDKQNLTLLGKINPTQPDKLRGRKLFQEQVAFTETPVTYLKIISQPVRSLPSWHPEKGKPAWVMISEIVID
jgi:hypothetical protein